MPSKSTEGKENNGTDSGETESGEGSWETEEEEVIEGVPAGKTLTASGPKSPLQAKQKKTESSPARVTDKQPKTKQVSSPVKKLTESLSSLSTQDTVMSGDSPGATEGGATQNPEAQTLYTWSSSKKPPGASKGNPSENDEIALVNVQVYNTRPVPKKFEIPPKGEYCDVHIINIFDPTNFVVRRIFFSMYHTVKEIYSGFKH